MELDPSRSKLTTWLTGTDHCTWRGVVCDGTLVSELQLDGQGLDGSLSSVELSPLTKLTSIVLDNNNLTGEVP